MTTVIEAARDYLARGWQIVPIPVGRKGPIVQGWQCRQWQPEDFEPDSNIGIILGPRSGDLVDVDHDCSEALMLAPIYLPPTGAIFGRSSKPRSHWLYVSPSAVKESFADLLSGEMLVELRAAGRDGAAHQTLVPPSVTNGERRTWEGDKIEPTTINAAKLHQRCVWLAVASLVARYVSETAAQRPGHDLPHLLYEADPVLGRKAFAWLGLPDPEAPQYSPKARLVLSATEVTLWELAAAIPNHGLAWDDWNAYGLAFFAASNGSEEGFIAFDRFSAQCGKYNGPETVVRWRHYRRSPPNATGLGKLIKAAITAGWRSNSPGARHAA